VKNFLNKSKSNSFPIRKLLKNIEKYEKPSPGVLYFDKKSGDLSRAH
jgi:hypothetical protein